LHPLECHAKVLEDDESDQAFLRKKEIEKRRERKKRKKGKKRKKRRERT
jgi:hypothetical protein